MRSTGSTELGDEAFVAGRSARAANARRTLRSSARSSARVSRRSARRLDGAPSVSRSRFAVVVTADYVDLETGTGAVHTAPGHGADDFETGMRYGLPIINPVDARGVFTEEAGPYAGMHIWKANPKIVEDLRESGALWNAFEYDAQLSALLALPQSGNFPRDGAMVHRDGSKPLARAHDRQHARRGLDARVGREAHRADAGKASRMVHLAPAHVGHADSGGRLHGVQRVGSRSARRAQCG